MDETQTLMREYGWRVAGRWNEDQLQILLVAGKAIQDYMSTLQHRPVNNWVRRYMPARFHTKGMLNRIQALKGKSFVFPWQDVWMQEGFEKGARPEWHVVHELGHVLDNRLGGLLPSTFSGGGPADEMLRAVGGEPEKCNVRFFPKGNYAALVTPFEHWVQGAYGDTCVAEDFAETFSYAIFRPELVPPKRLQWMQNYLRRLQ